MELKQYITIFKNNAILIVVMIFLSAAIAFAFAAKMPAGFVKTQSYVIVPKDTHNDNFGGFYQQEKSRNFTDSAVAIIENQNSGSLQAQKIAPQIIKVTASGQDQNQTNIHLSQGLEKLNATLQNLSPQNPLEVRPLTEPSVATKVVFNKKIVTTFGAIVGLTTAFVIIGLKSYLKL